MIYKHRNMATKSANTLQGDNVAKILWRTLIYPRLASRPCHVRLASVGALVCSMFNVLGACLIPWSCSISHVRSELVIVRPSAGFTYIVTRLPAMLPCIPGSDIYIRIIMYHVNLLAHENCIVRAEFTTCTAVLHVARHAYQYE